MLAGEFNLRTTESTAHHTLYHIMPRCLLVRYLLQPALNPVLTY